MQPTMNQRITDYAALKLTHRNVIGISDVEIKHTTKLISIQNNISKQVINLTYKTVINLIKSVIDK